MHLYFTAHMQFSRMRKRGFGVQAARRNPVIRCRKMTKFLFAPALLLPLAAQQPPATQPAPPAAPPPQTAQTATVPNAGNDEVLKRVDDLMWHLSLGDIAHI